jgi:hypothetical protein
MVQIKFFEASSLRFLEVRINEFLKRLDKNDVMNVSIATSEQENVQPARANHIAGIMFHKPTKRVLNRLLSLTQLSKH